MKTFNQFYAESIELFLEDKRGLSPEQQARFMEIKRSKGATAANSYFKAITSRSVRNLPPDQQEKLVNKTSSNPLPKGYVGKWNPETQSYENINPRVNKQLTK